MPRITILEGKAASIFNSMACIMSYALLEGSTVAWVSARGGGCTVAAGGAEQDHAAHALRQVVRRGQGIGAAAAVRDTRFPACSNACHQHCACTCMLSVMHLLILQQRPRCRYNTSRQRGRTCRCRARLPGGPHPESKCAASAAGVGSLWP